MRVVVISAEDFVRKRVFHPAGLAQVRRARNLLEERLPGEVRYYDRPGEPPAPSSLLPDRPLTPNPYGILDLYGMPAIGGWVGSAIHLLRLAVALDSQRLPGLLQPASVERLSERGFWLQANQYYYALGMYVRLLGPLQVWSHGGTTFGSRSDWGRLSNGLSFAWVSNGENTRFFGRLTASLTEICRAARVWPDHDLFPHYLAPYADPSRVVNAASYQAGPVAPGSLLSVFGSELASRAEQAAALPLPSELGGLSVRLRDREGAERPAGLVYASLAQVNLLLPEDLTPGPASLLLRRSPHEEVRVPFQVQSVAPGLYSLDGAGLAAATLTRVLSDGSRVSENVYAVDSRLFPLAFHPRATPAATEV